MSIKIMQKVFEDETLNSTKKLIMLSMADNANDEGFCYPSIPTIMKKVSLSKPTVINNLKELEDDSYIMSQKRNRKNGSATSKIYIVYPKDNFSRLDEEIKEKFKHGKAPLPHGKAPLPPKGGQSKAPLPLEPSLNSLNHHLEPREILKEQVQEKNLNPYEQPSSAVSEAQLKNEEAKKICKYFDHKRKQIQPSFYRNENNAEYLLTRHLKETGRTPKMFLDAIDYLFSGEKAIEFWRDTINNIAGLIKHYNAVEMKYLSGSKDTKKFQTDKREFKICLEKGMSEDEYISIKQRGLDPTQVLMDRGDF